MQYNPNIHNRKNLRLKGFDYSEPGQYFITICTHRKEHRFGYIENGEMFQNKYGQIAIEEWIKLGDHFSGIEPGIFVVMPNHMHGIIHIVSKKRSTRDGQPQGIAPTVGDITGAYKSKVSTACLDIYSAANETMGKLWQRNYYEHIIRNERSYNIIANYIINNPETWEIDNLFTIQ